MFVRLVTGASEMILPRTIKASMRRGEESGYAAECLEVPLMTQE